MKKNILRFSLFILVLIIGVTNAAQVNAQTAPLFFTGGARQSITVCENSTANPINTQLTADDITTGRTVNWTSLVVPLFGTAVVTYTTTSTGGTLIPTGLSYTPNTGYTGLDSFKVKVQDGGYIDSTKIIVNVIPPFGGVITGPSSVCPGFTISISDTATGGTWSSSNTGIATITGGGLVDGISAGNVIISYQYASVCGTAYSFSEINVGDRIINTIGGGGGSLGDGGPATAGQFSNPPGIYVDGARNIIVGDFTGSRVRKIDAGGIITTLAGTGSATSTGDGLPATSASVTVDNPEGVWEDAGGNIYIAEQNGCRVRKINSAGIISTIMGNGTCSSTGDGGLAISATIDNPTGITVDGAGNIYIAEWGAARIRKISTAGIASTIAGTGVGGYYGDGVPALSAELDEPYGLAYDGVGNLYLGDESNARVRQINLTTGIITTIAGGGASTADNIPATSASLSILSGVYADAYNVYVACSGAEKVRVINKTSGIITTVAGTGTAGFSGDGGLATAANLRTCAGVALDANMNVYIADFSNARIREVTTVNPSVASITGAPFVVCPLANITLSDATAGGTWTTSASSIATVGSSSGIVTGVAEGTTTITYSVLFPCGTLTATQTVTVNPGPDPITPGSIGVCPGDSVLVSDATSGGTWSTGSTNISISSTGEVTGITSGGSTISYTNSYSCSATHFVFVFTPPSPIVPSSATVCAGATVSLSDATSGGTWSSSATTIATTGTSGIVTGVSAGTATISYAAGSGSCYVSASVTVNPQPLDITPAGALTICLGATTLLSDATSGGTWSSGTTSVATINSGGLADGIGIGTSTISYTNGFGCSTTKTATVIAGPSAISPSAAVVCAGSITTLSDATGSGIWSSSATGIATVGTSGTVDGMSAGSATITYSVGSCYALASVTVNALPNAGYISGSPDICIGSSAPLTDATSGGGWSSTNTGVATVTGSGVVHGVSTGTATISYTVVGASCIGAAILTVTVHALPGAGSITGPTQVCESSTISLTDAVSGGVWSSSNTSISTVSGGVVTGVLAGDGDIFYTVTSAFGCVNVAFAGDTVNAAPDPVSGTPSVCIGSATILTDGIGGGTWSSSNTSVASNVGGVVTGLSVGTATISYALGSGTSGCIATKIVTVISSPAAVSPSSASVCTGNSITLSDATGGGTWMSGNTVAATVSSGTVTGVAAGTTTITYTVGGCYAIAPVTVNTTPANITPSGAVSICAGTNVSLSDVTGGGAWSSENTSIATVTGGLVTGVSAGTVNISYTSPFGCAAVKSVTINAAPAAITPSTASVCVESTTNLSDATGGGAWTSSNANATVSGGVVTGVAAGSVTITYAIGSCTSTATVTVNPIPAAITPSGAVSVCAGTNTTLSDATGGGAWSSSNTSIATVAGGIVTGTGAGTVNISYTIGFGCAVVKSVNVNTAPTSIIPASPTVCAGSTLNLSDAVSGGGWSSSATAIATIGSTGVVTGVAAGTAIIVYNIGSCFTISTLTVNPLPVAGSITGPSTMCAGTSITLSDAASGGVWSSGNTTVATVGGGTGMVTGLAGGTTTISYSVTNVCGTANATASVTVNTIPNAGTIIGPSSVCSGTYAVLSDAVTGGTWSVSNIKASITGTGLITGISPGTDTISYSVTTVCGTGTTTATIAIGPFLTAGTISGGNSLCAGTTITLSDPATGGVWSSSNASATVSGSGVVTGVSGGADTILYTVTASCGAAIATHTITVKPIPVAGSISGPSLICTGTVAAFSDAATGGVWSTTNVKATITGTGLLTAITPGTDTIVYTVTNTCGTKTATAVVTMGTFLSAGTITGASGVCAGSSITLSDVFTGGVWSSGNTTLALVGISGIVTGISAGTDTITYTVTAACGSASATHTVMVNPLPVAGSISGPSAVCLGTTITLSDAATGGVWSSSNAHATISGGLVTPVTTGTDTIIYKVTNSCGSASATQVITIGSFLTAGSITGAAGVCAGSTITLSDTAPGGVWSSSNTSVAIVGVTGIVTGTGAGTDTISYTFANVCGTAIATATVTVNPLANAGVISGPGSVCIGSAVTLTDPATGGVWSASNGHATVSGGVVTPVSTGTDTISYSVTNGCGTVAAVQIISIGTSPTAGSITGPAGVCLGSAISLSDAIGGGVWSSSNTAIALVGTGGTVIGIGVGKDVISYTVATACGIATATATVAVDLTPNAGSIIGPSGICAGTFTIFTDAAAGGIWSSSNSSATITGLGGVLDALTPLTLDTVIYTVTNGCGTAIATKPIAIGIFFTPGTITGSSVLCTGVATSLTDAVSGGVWSSSNTGIAIVGTTGITTGLTSGADTISYTLTASCGIATAIKAITVNPSPNPGVITGLSSVCVGSLVTLTDVVSGGTWGSSNANATVTTGGIVTGILPGADTISYSVTNSCGTVAATKVMVINTIVSAGTITGPGSVCMGASVALSDAVSGGMWSSANTAIATVGSSGIVTGVNAASDVINYTVGSACGISTATTTIIVNPLPDPGTITGSFSICIGSSALLADAVSGGVWSAGNANATITGGGLVTGVTLGTDPISYTVTNGCGATSAMATVTVATTPVSGIISGPSGVCAGSGITLTDPVPGGMWLTANAFAVVAAPGIIDGVAAGVDTVFYQVTNGCGTSVASKIISVNPVPFVAPVSGSGDQCAGSLVTLTDAVTGGVWTSSNLFVATIGISSGVATGVAPGTATITYTVTNLFGCPTSVTYNDTVVVMPVIPAITGGTNACVGSGTALSDTYGGGMWSSSNTAIATIDASTGIVNGVTAGAVTMSYTVVNVCGSSTVTTSITVNPLPPVAAITGPVNVCAGATATLSDATTGGVWASSNTVIATIGTSSGIVAGVSAGSANMFYIVTNVFGCSASIMQTETVNAVPVVAAITGATHQCMGAAITLSDITGGGVWSSSNTAVATVAGTGVVSAVSPGNAFIMYNITGSFGCNTTVASPDTVVALPVVAAITGPSDACLGASITLNDVTTGGVWTSGNTAIATIDAGTGVVTAVSIGSVMILYNVTNTWGCMSGVSASVTVNPIPVVATVTGPTMLCPGQTINLSDATAGGAWSSGNTTIATISSTGMVTGVYGGSVILFYTITGTGGCTNESGLPVTVSPAIPTAVILPAGSATLCHGNSVVLHVATSGGTIDGYQWVYNGVAIPGATNATYTTNTAGMFSVIVSNGLCSETLTATNIVAPPDPVIFYTSPDVLYTGSFATYEWFLNGNLIPGAASSTIHETEGGLYTVVVTDANGCTDTSFAYKINNGKSSVNSIVNNANIRVYPNPASSLLHIDAPEQVNVALYSIEGKLLLEQKDATNIDIANLANGMYMIMIYDANGLLLKTAKFAKIE